MKQIRAIIDVARPRQWLKNGLLFLPILFGGYLFDGEVVWKTILAFFSFCLLSSSNYILNDILDAASDRRHPFKRVRPVATRELPEKRAIIVSLMFAASGLAIGYTISSSFVSIALGFILLHYGSYYIFRYHSVIDVLAISAGYLLRVLAGEAASGYHISVWLFLTVLSASLLLAIGKRRAELSFLKIHDRLRDGIGRGQQFLYSERLLDAYVAVFANATFVTYAYFTFLTVQGGSGLFRGMDGVVAGWLERKWLMITVPPALYAIMRYLQIIYSVREGLLEKLITTDKALISSVVIWGASVLLVVYGLGQ